MWHDFLWPYLRRNIKVPEYSIALAFAFQPIGPSSDPLAAFAFRFAFTFAFASASDHMEAPLLHFWAHPIRILHAAYLEY